MSSDQLHTFTCLLMLWSALAFAETENTLPASPVAKPFAIGETVSFNSEILQQQRTINVYLPAGYQTNPSQKYPVIYLLDGSADEDFIHLAGLVQFNAFSWINKVPESIVIGIANIDRKQDFTHPTSIEADRKAFPTTGQSARFIRFIRDELQPLVSQRYRTTAQNTLIGQSLGGLLATEILLKQPDMFTRYLIVSPSLWWDNGSLLQARPNHDFSEKTVFIAVGNEGPVMIKAAKDLADYIRQHKSAAGRMTHRFYPQLNHGDTLHLAAYDGLQFIFAIGAPDSPLN